VNGTAASATTAGWAGLASWEQMTRLQIGIRVPDLAPLRTPPGELHNHTHGRGGCQDAKILHFNGRSFWRKLLSTKHASQVPCKI
jgi:hypothetical protein